MDLVYSVALLLSSLAALAWLSLAIYRLIAGRPGPAANWLGWLSVAALLASLLTHIMFGHAPGGEQGLSPMEFIRGHPAYLWLAGTLLVLFFLRAKPPGSSREGGDEDR